MATSYDDGGPSPTPFDSLQSQPEWIRNQLQTQLQLQSNPIRTIQPETEIDVFACNDGIDQLRSIEESFTEFVATLPVSTFESNFGRGGGGDDSEEEFAPSNPLEANQSKLHFNPLPDSDQYIANLEKRIAKLKNRKVFIHPERVRGTGSEFFVTSSRGIASSSTFDHPTSSWLDDNGDDDGDDDNGKSKDLVHGGDSYHVDGVDDSSEDECTAEKDESKSNVIQPSIEEQISLLDQHEQLLVDEEQTTSQPISNGVLFDPSSSSTAMVSMVGPSSNFIEMSDGNAVGGPSHVRSSTSVPAPVPRRQLYYESQTCLAQAINWWEESKGCNIC